MTTQQKHDWKLVIGSNLVTLICAVLLFFGTQDTNKTEQLTAAYNQIKIQGDQIIELRQMLVKTQLEVVNLQVRLSENLDRAVILQDYLNFQPFPAWIKSWDEQKQRFIMVMINDAYTAEYGITRGEYVGKDDWAVHPPYLAEIYQTNDKLVRESGKPHRSIEVVKMPDGKKRDIIVYKYPILLGDGTLGIGGVSIYGD